jgi:hypothetical protein
MRMIINQYKATVTRQDDHFVDDCGDKWFIVADDMRANYAVDREDGGAAGMVCLDQLFAKREGDTFDVNNPAEFVVIDGQWERNED